MISFSFKGSVLTASIDVQVPNAGMWTFKTSVDVTSQAYAAFLDHAMRTQLMERIETVRRAEYISGYRDGRAKRKMRDWFRSSLSVNAP